MALAPLPTRIPAPIAGCARRVERRGTTSVLVLDDGRTVALASAPDPAGATRCRRSFNHVVSVRLEGAAHDVRASVRGIGNRLPVTIATSVATALALVETGVPAVVALTGEVDG